MAIFNKKNEIKIKKKNMPALPLRDIVIFPQMVVPLFVGRTKSLNAVEEAIANEGYLVVVFQKDPQIEEPGYKDIYSTGVLTKIIQSLKESTGVMKILVEVLERVKINDFTTFKNFFAVNFDYIKEEIETDKETEAMSRLVLELLQKYLNLNLSVPKELYNTIATLENPSKICDTITGYLPLKIKDKIKILETLSVKNRLSYLIEILNEEIEVLEVQKKIQDKVIKKIEDTQKQYILTEQLKQIQKELGKEEETPEIAELREKIKKACMPKNVEEKAIEELNRLSKMMPLSPEATVSRTYIEWLCSLPWAISTQDNLD
ncbi:MAG: LON peptidase substrate-binding domain-containing protein, partial [Candidatus Ratteibacteria bacterium]